MKKILLFLMLLLPCTSNATGFKFFERRGNCAVWQIMNYYPEQFLTFEYSRDGIEFVTIDSPVISYDLSSLRLTKNGYYRAVVNDNSGYRLCSPILKVTGLEQAVISPDAVFRYGAYQIEVIDGRKELKLL